MNIVIMVLFRVRQLRQRYRYEGARKLQLMLSNPDYGLPVRIGRDRLFDLLKQYDLQSELRIRFKRTSFHNHHDFLYPNLLKDAQITELHQAWVCDITYLRLAGGKFCYLFLVTELISRKIIGYDLRTSLSAEGAIQALHMALNFAKPKAGFIHHSDHGVQYCCKEYRNLLTKHGARISMTGENYCYDNAVAERLNGTLKREYGLGAVISNFAAAKTLTYNGIKIYNSERLHQSLKYKTPDYVYSQLNASDYVEASIVL